MGKKEFVDTHRNARKLKKVYLIGTSCIILGVLCFLLPVVHKNNNSKIENELINDFFSDSENTETNTVDNQLASVKYIDASPNSSNVTIIDTTKNTTTVEGLEEEYKKYNMVVEVENVGIKKGIYPLSSPYNNIKHNVQLMQTSTMPDCKNGNVILAAHNGNSSVSYFDNLKNSKVGDAVNLYYHGIKYIYKLVNIYDVPKNGTVEIKRDSTKSCVTLITCKSKDKSKQVVYIGELSDTKQY